MKIYIIITEWWRDDGISGPEHCHEEAVVAVCSTIEKAERRAQILANEEINELKSRDDENSPDVTFLRNLKEYGIPLRICVLSVHNDRFYERRNITVKEMEVE